MTYLVGADEAGYGPNLGPLVVSATVWHVPGSAKRTNLYDTLREVVLARPTPSATGHPIVVADSKALYKARGGLQALELGVLASLAAIDIQPLDWRQLFSSLDPGSEAARETLPWYTGFNASLPVEADRDEVQASAAWLRDGLARGDAALQNIQSTVVYPERFNRMVDRLGSKGAALSTVTLQLVAKLLAPLSGEPVLVVCDKHGGRNKYGPLLQEHFPDYLVEIHGEARSESIYHTGPADRRVEFRFRAKGESFLPSALASMVCKYLRELSMLAFNAFWRKHHHDLKPTAGYPVDARRFMEDIAELCQSLEIEDHILWRRR